MAELDPRMQPRESTMPYLKTFALYLYNSREDLLGWFELEQNQPEFLGPFRFCHMDAKPALEERDSSGTFKNCPEHHHPH